MALLSMQGNRSLSSVEGNPTFYDSGSQCRIHLATPQSNPQSWEQHLAGAYESYKTFGVLRALDYEEIADGRSTSLFYLAVDGGGRVVGGVRAQGPYTSADEAHAVVEWDGCEGREAVRQMVEERLPEGVVELKNGWVSPAARRKREVADAISRCIVHTTALLDVRYALGTGADHVLGLWRKSGGVVVDGIPAALYPSNRYSTKLVWWDRMSFAGVAEQNQVVQTYSEWLQIASATGLPNDRIIPSESLR